MIGTKHTPAPWRNAGYAGQHEEAGAHIVGPNGQHIASTWGGLREASPREDWLRYHADAHLIEKAPEILDALWDVLDSLGALGGSWHELLGWGFSEERAKAIVQLVEEQRQ